MNKIVSTKRTSAIFLAIVLVAGTIATILPSFMTIEAVQAQPYYDEMDNDYNSYGPPQYVDRNNYYNSYESDYGMDDNNDRKSYGKDNNYKPQKDSNSKKSVSINKLKCINNNININGVNSGDINIGNKGGVTEEGYLGANSYSGEGYYNGHSKKDKSFDCIINNNNTNINLVGGGNQTEPLTCEKCFTENLSAEQLNNLTIALSVSRVGNLEGLYEQFLSNTTLTNQEKLFGLSVLLSSNAGITDVDAILRVLECLEELRLIIVPPNFDPILR